MDSLSDLMASPLPSEAASAQKKCYVTYQLSLLEDSFHNVYSPSITLLESRSLISASGTTGLRTWEAALHLGQYLCSNRSLVRGRRVLELGTGTGYLAVLCAKYLGAAQVVASDGSEDVITLLHENLFVNGLQGSSVVLPMKFTWGHGLPETEEGVWNRESPMDIVLGADITYDEAVIPSLVSTLRELLATLPGLQILISATERNKQTYASFMTACEQRGMDVTRLENVVPISSGSPFYSKLVPIHICRVS